MWAVVVVAAMVTAPFAVIPAGAAEVVVPPVGTVAVSLVTATGAGCPAGGAAVSLSPDNTAVGLSYENMVARTGPGARSADWRRNCQVAVMITAPPGFTYAIAQADYDGSAYLPKAARGILRTAFFLAGTSPGSYRQHAIEGPLSDEAWHVSDVVDPDALSWVPCGERRLINLNGDLRIDLGELDPAVTMTYLALGGDSLVPAARYRLAWKTCETAGAKVTRR